jgi:YhcH/YjgK/YiaL family protein
MIYDKLENAEKYCAMHAGFKAAFAFLRETDLEALDTGPAELDGERLHINVIEASCRPEEEVQLEIHKKYIDIQYMVSGEERFSWKGTRECMEPAGEFDPETDFGLFCDQPTGWFPLMEGCFVIFFPDDAHGPMCGAGEVRKIVVKVAVDWE